jgi:hypothetical protein
MFITSPKRGKLSKRPGKVDAEGDHSPSTMYGASEFGGGRPDGSRRFTGLYGKNAKARNETDVESGEESRRSGRMFNWMKGDSY